MSETGEVKETKKVNGPFDKIRNNESKELRPPKNLPSDLSIPATTNEPDKTDELKDAIAKSQNLSEVQKQKVLNSTLNANAAEFVPLSNQNTSSINNVNQDDQIHDIISYLKEELNYLILNPGKYDEAIPPLLEVFEPFINNENALRAIISVIIDECIAEPNLRYNGARLCNDLYNKFQESYYIFRKVFLNRCQEIHEELVQSSYSSDASVMTRIQGFGMLLAELFLQIKLNARNEKSFSVFGLAIVEVLQIILKNESEKGVKSVCQILKLAGKQLDEVSRARSKTDSRYAVFKKDLDEVYSRLASIRTYVDLDPNLRFIVTSVLDMRASNWGENSPHQSSAEEIQSNTEFFNDPVFFGPDGKVISEEETSFLQESVPFSEDTEDYVCEQEMDEEVLNDFMKFLKLNQV